MWPSCWAVGLRRDHTLCGSQGFLLQVHTEFVCVWPQSWPTLGKPMDCSPPGSSVHGILQARILECTAISFSRGSSRPRDWTPSLILLHWQAGSLPRGPPGKPGNQIVLQIKNVQPLLIHTGLNSSRLNGPLYCSCNCSWGKFFKGPMSHLFHLPQIICSLSQRRNQ